jgi:hypothetical protein
MADTELQARFAARTLVKSKAHRDRAQTERRGHAGPVRGLRGGKDRTGRLYRDADLESEQRLRVIYLHSCRTLL